MNSHPGRDGIVLDEGQDERGRADLQEGRDLRRVAVAHDHVQAPVFTSIGVGLVTGVDDRPFQGGLEPNLFFEEVGPLGELEVHLVGALPWKLGADLAGAGEDLPGDEVCGAVLDDPPERCFPAHQIVLVGAVAVALAVGVVLVEHQLLARREELVRCGHRTLHDELAGPVVQDHAERVGTLRRRHFGVGVIDVVASAISQDGVDEVGLDLGWHRAHRAEPSGVGPGRLIDEIPGDHLGTGVSPVTVGCEIGVDQQ